MKQIKQDQADLAGSGKRDVATIAAEEEMIANTQNRLPRDLEEVVQEEDTRVEKYEAALSDEITQKQEEMEKLEKKKKEEEEIIEERKAQAILDIEEQQQREEDDELLEAMALKEQAAQMKLDYRQEMADEKLQQRVQ